MKIIHCADVHLDSKMTAHLPPEKAGQRRRELLHTFRRMLEFAAQNEVAAVIIAGDLFDGDRISALAKNTVYEGITAYPHIDFYYLRGNHDASSFLNELTDIPPNLKLFGQEWTYYTADAGGAGNIVISGLELTEQNLHRRYEDLTLDSRCFNIVVLHGQIGSGGQAESIHLKALQNKGIDYLALGHIHSYQMEKLDARASYCYSGCLEARGFDECGEHGFVLLEIDGQTRQYRHTFVPAAARRFHEIFVDISACRSSGEIAGRIEGLLQAQAFAPGDMMKLILTGRQEIGAEKDVEMLTQQFRDRFYFFKIYDQAGWQVDYRRYETEPTLKGEFVRLLQRQENLDEAEKAEIIQYGLSALNGEVME